MQTPLAALMPVSRRILHLARHRRARHSQFRVSSTSTSQRHSAAILPPSNATPVSNPHPFQQESNTRQVSSDSWTATPNVHHLELDPADVTVSGAPDESRQVDGQHLRVNDDSFSDLTFDDHTEAFHRKTTWEVIRALSILSLCSNQYLVDNSLELMLACRRVLGRRLTSALFRPTVYKQFVGGETAEEIQSCVESLGNAGIRPMLACTVEEDIGISPRSSEAVYFRNQTKVLRCLELSSNLGTPSPMMQLKMSGLLNANLLALMSEFYTRSPSRQNLVEAVAELMAPGGKDILHLKGVDYDKIQSIKNGIRRLSEIGQVAVDKGVKVLVDAEYTYLNPALNWLTVAMMAVFNQSSPVIWNTYQCYLKDAMKNVRHDLALAEAFDACFGAKIVRGAYLSQERSRAAALRYPDPVCDSYQATNANYQRVVSFLLHHIKSSNKECNMIIATHNEESIKKALSTMRQLGISEDSGRACFGQLLGMCDQVTYPLAAANYAVYKSIPCGRLDEVLPYLARRAMENKTVLAGARKELELLSKELASRIWKPFSFRQLRRKMHP